MMKKCLGILFILWLAVFSNSCYHLPTLPFNALPKDSIVCFQNDVLPILQTNCGKSGCHDGSRDELNFTNYEGCLQQINVADPINSRIIQAIYRKRMPPPPNQPLTQNQIDLIYIWIQQGGHNTSCSEKCDTVNVGYSASVQPIFNTYCIGCHNGVTAGTTINLTSWSALMQTTSPERVMGSVEHLDGFVAMPQDANKLSDCKIGAIRRWVVNGAPDN